MVAEEEGESDGLPLSIWTLCLLYLPLSEEDDEEHDAQREAEPDAPTRSLLSLRLVRHSFSNFLLNVFESFKVVNNHAAQGWAEIFVTELLMILVDQSFEFSKDERARGWWHSPATIRVELSAVLNKFGDFHGSPLC